MTDPQPAVSARDKRRFVASSIIIGATIVLVLVLIALFWTQSTLLFILLSVAIAVQGIAGIWHLRLLLFHPAYDSSPEFYRFRRLILLWPIFIAVIVAFSFILEG